ncbi:MAG TPA: triose-phosphate isomerase [Acidimicrobiia bacterium]|nr:triose-phosphate isomerase [Acidimicrobiia bacterium]
MRKPIIVGNWKMNLTHLESIALVQKLSYRLEREVFDSCEVVVCPPFTSLRSVQTTIDSDKMEIALGAQNVNENDKGAFTGEVSASMLSKITVRYVLVGHSERRAHCHETNEQTSLKVKAVRKFEMTPILCVGETREQRDAGESNAVVEAQVREGLAGIAKGDIENCVIAYEPVWAIGAGQPATIEQANEMIFHIRGVLSSLSSGSGETTRVIYGASVDPGNAKMFLSQDGIDGLLVGGASLEADDFSRLVISAVK